jgi:hypothetical protein
MAGALIHSGFFRPLGSTHKTDPVIATHAGYQRMLAEST